MDIKLFKNILSLIGMQGVNYLIPLITLPYIVRTLNPEGYGALGFSLAIVQYFVFIVEYGFNLSATQNISRHQDDTQKISEIFWNVTICRIILCIFSAFLLFVMVTCISELSVYINIILAAFSLVIGSVLFPIWLFQGKENMGFIAIITISAKLLSIPLVFIFVNDSEDAWVSALIVGVGTVFSGLLSLLVIVDKNWIIWVKPTIKGIIGEYRDGWHIFISSAAVTLYTTSITVILGFTVGPIAVGYFVAADKIRMAAQGVIAPISQAIYPRINAIMAKDQSAALAMMKKLFYYQSIGAFLLSLLLSLLSSKIIMAVYGSNYIPSIHVLFILAWSIFFIGISNVLGIQTLLVYGYKKIFSNILILAGVINIFMVFPLTWMYEQLGAAISVFITEVVVVILMIIIIENKKIPLFRRSK